MNRQVAIRIAIGALFVGIGVAVIGSARRLLAPCDEISPEETARAVAEAAVEVVEGIDADD